MLNKNSISIINLQKSIYQLHLAEHLLEVTYPLVKDPKMLLSVLSNLEQSHESLLESVLLSDLKSANTSFLSTLKSFEDLLQPVIALKEGEIKTIKTVHDLVEQHKESVVAFSRKNTFIICEEDYKMKKIDPLLVGEQIHNTKKLIMKLFSLVEKND